MDNKGQRADHYNDIPWFEDKLKDKAAEIAPVTNTNDKLEGVNFSQCTLEIKKKVVLSFINKHGLDRVNLDNEAKKIYDMINKSNEDNTDCD